MTTLSSYIQLPLLSGNTQKVALAFIGSLLIAISAQITVPMFPIPMTMQTFAVLTIAVVMGGRLGALSLLMYIAEGAMGLPVFAGGKGGLPVLMGPTGGYLIGFVISAYIVGSLAEKGFDRNAFKMFVGYDYW